MDAPVSLAPAWLPSRPPRELSGRTPFRLDDPALAWLVTSGEVNLFLVSSGEEAGGRRPCLTLGAGEIAFGFAAGEHGLVVLAAGLEGTRLQPVPVGALWAAAEDDAPLAWIAARLERWTAGLTQALAAALPGVPPADVLLGTEGEQEVAAGSRLRARRGLLWLRLAEGTGLYTGTEEVGPAVSRPWVPLDHRCWVEVLTPGTVRVADTPALLASGQAGAALDAWHGLFLAAAALNVRLGDVDELNRRRARETRQARQLSRALEELAALTGDRRVAPAPAEGGDPLFACCAAVGGAVGLSVTAPARRPDAPPPRDPLGEILAASGVRSRRITLPADWWREEAGPFLGWRKGTGEPLALLPLPGGGYDIWDPATGTRRRADAAGAREVAPAAVMFYRSLPATALRLRTALAFGLRQGGPDAAHLALLLLGAGLVSWLAPALSGWVLGSVIPRGDRGDLALALAGLAAGLFAAAGLQVVQGLALLRLEGRADAALGAAVMDRLLRLPAGFFRDFSAGDLGQRALAVSTLRQLLGGVIAGTLIPAVTAVSAVGLIALVDPRVALGALALMALPVGAALLTAYRQLGEVRGQARLQGQLAGLLLEVLGGLAKLRVAAAERGAFTRWARVFAGLRRHALAAREAHGRLATLLAALPMVALAALIAGLGLLGEPEPSPAVFLTLVAALTQGLAAAIAFGESTLLLTAAAPLAERLEAILQAPPEVAGEAGDPGELTGAIELAHVSFRYEGQAQPVLHDVSLRVAPGEFVAFVGPSGSGKSTLLRLLLGFERPERGAVHYDGRNLAALDVTAVRRQLGVVLQAGRLMPGSLLENIRGGGLLTLDEAWAAARHAGLEEDIRALPMGMHTVIGEGSSTLSGGQRQRLLIARALARQPRILFLDEATSALDNRTQAMVSRSLEQLQCTRVVIAHRLSTVVNADRIHVLAEGRIVQTGTYEELAAQEGLFRDLVRRQVA